MARLQFPVRMIGTVEQIYCPFSRLRKGEEVACGLGFSNRKEAVKHVYQFHPERVRQSKPPEAALFGPNGEPVTDMPLPPGELAKPELEF